ncbi:hypothetical protein L7B14_004244 [Salmonella enterica]|nr:hypothetical protein [Salmonella enterica]
MNEIILAAIQHGYLISRKLSEEAIDMIRTNYLLGNRMVSIHDSLTILKPEQIHLIQTNVYMQYQIPGTELRLTLEPCSNSQFEWPTPSVQEMYHFIRVEGA